MDFDEMQARESIRDTLARYNQAGDNDDAEAYAATFAEDGIFEALGLRQEGRAEILAWKKSHRIFAASSFRMHHVSSTRIDFETPDSANVVSNWLAMTDAGPDHCGRYEDRFVRVGKHWLIEHRRVEILWKSAAGVLGGSSLPSSA
jgi:uncharacterized protein (TIGR02246 family)